MPDVSSGGDMNLGGRGVIKWDSRYKEDEQSELNAFAPSCSNASLHRLSTDSYLSFTSSTTASSIDSSVVTPPLLTAETDGASIFDYSDASPISTHSSPSYMDEDTPRAEQPAPVWPLALLADKTVASGHHKKPGERRASERGHGDSLDRSRTHRETPIDMDEDWDKQRSSPASPCTSSQLAASAIITSTKRRPSPILAGKDDMPISVEATGLSAATHEEAVDTQTSSSISTGRQSEESVRSSKSQLVESPVTGCCISGPISPPAHYPGPTGSRNAGPRFSSPARGRCLSSTGSVVSSSSLDTQLPTPTWAQSPRLADSATIDTTSPHFGQEQVDNEAFPKLMENSKDSWSELIKGAEGRIAIRSSTKVYDVMAWLPGFSIENITIAIKGLRTMNIVADHWDHGDHAEWDVRLGEDANLKAVEAKFKSHQLTVSVSRDHPPVQESRLFRSSSPPLSAPAILTSPSSSTSNAQDRSIADKCAPQIARAGRCPNKRDTDITATKYSGK